MEASAGLNLLRWKEAGSYGDVVLQKNVMIVIDKESYEWRSSAEGRKRKNANEENKEETAWISGTHHEKREVGNLTVTGKIEGKRSKGRKRSSFMESLSTWVTKQVPTRKKTQMTKQALLSATKDRERWRGIIAYVFKWYGTTTTRMYILLAVILKVAIKGVILTLLLVNHAPVFE